MILTINTDASFHPKLKYGGYCFWAVCDSFRFKRSGELRKKLKSPEQAEIKCIINALVYIFSHEKSRDIQFSKIIINTDCLNAIEALKGNRKHLRRYRCFKQLYSFHNYFNEILKKYNREDVVFEFRKVDAHSNGVESRDYVNEYCDRWAKKRMWERVNRSGEIEKEYKYIIPLKYEN